MSDDFSALQCLDEELTLPQSQRRLLLACELGRAAEVESLLHDPTVSSLVLDLVYCCREPFKVRKRDLQL